MNKSQVLFVPLIHLRREGIGLGEWGTGKKKEGYLKCSKFFHAIKNNTPNSMNGTPNSMNDTPNSINDRISVLGFVALI